MSAVTLECTISRVRFKAQDTGYVVLVTNVTDQFEDVIAVGTMPDAEEKMCVELSGDWIVHPKFGKQFKFERYGLPQATSAEGIISYLSTLKGLKGSLAKRVYDEFGEDIYRVLDEEPEQLTRVKGIAAKKLDQIIESYIKTKGMRELIAFLHDLGVSAGYATRIFNQYGQESIGQIKANPYILAETVRGFGFKRADEVARGLNIAPDSFVRITAGIHHTLKTAANQGGHCFLPMDTLCSSTCELLILPGYSPKMDDIEVVVKELGKSKYPKWQQLQVEGDDVYTYSMWVAETETADFIKQTAGEFQSFTDIESWLDEYEEIEGLTLASGQREAVRTANRYKFMVLTGGAGVGKSSVSRAIVKLWHSQRKRIIACAPTGKASQRIKECTGVPATTIHRLLGWSGTGFFHNRDNQLEGDVFLIDESSMQDIKLFHALISAIPRHASVVMIGDVNQLPSVGPGNVLRDIINSGVIPVVRLTEVFRQGPQSKIIPASHQINNGKYPDLELIGKGTVRPYTDALYLKCPPEVIPIAIKYLLEVKLPEWGWDREDIQCLSPMHKGDIGNTALNEMIQNLWNPSEKGKKETRGFREGDRVIQMRNNYDKGIFNGDIGVIEEIDKTEGLVFVRFPDEADPQGKLVELDDQDLSDMMLGYSISVHKSQGSEFPVIIMPLAMSQNILLQRNLLYTGFTRGKKLSILVGEEKALKQAIRVEKNSKRNTKLDLRLRA